ncbi:probable Co/Zn/Cd efflux system membrane fusion protein [Nonlabens ulvanivorans]|uniref:Probable Co/Zn/Cd efflux system membrane fusion protein n=1 Tax=Nonlabens ulvanivorans TaxID=906888 RepID=A0A090QDZ4_NONUL|nr:probable Co/Zn/Cd efflux system membrane fusion protein [Nonlabens ulvanivorans]
MSCGEKESQPEVDNSPAIPVTVQAVIDNNSSPFLAVSGKVQAANSAQLSTRMMGFVNNILVNVGDPVKKGQLLVAINNADLQAKKGQVNASITEATAAFNNAQKDYNRFKNLFADNSASQKELDDITANFNMAKARLEGAQQMKNEINAQFAYSNITAPFNGVITSKNIKKGDMANPGQPLLSIEAPGDFEVMAMVPETEISQIKKETEVQVTISSIQQTLTGKVKEVSTSAQQTGGQYLVKITIDKTDVPVLSGMFATIAFPVERKAANHNVLIPSSALITKGQLTGVYTISENNTAMLRWLRLGRTLGDQVEILSGLNADEKYITSSNGKLFNGAKVTIQ